MDAQNTKNKKLRPKAPPPRGSSFHPCINKKQAEQKHRRAPPFRGYEEREFCGETQPQQSWNMQHYTVASRATGTMPGATTGFQRLGEFSLRSRRLQQGEGAERAIKTKLTMCSEGARWRRLYWPSRSRPGSTLARSRSDTSSPGSVRCPRPRG